MDMHHQLLEQINITLFCQIKRIESLVKIIRQLGYDKEIKTVPHGEDCLGWKKKNNVSE